MFDLAIYLADSLDVKVVSETFDQGDTFAAVALLNLQVDFRGDAEQFLFGIREGI
jgi:hypothetical protein